MPLSVDQLSTLYKMGREDFVDYGAHRPGNWLLVSAGTGLMMGVCDVELRFRYALDADILPLRSRARFADWLEGMGCICDRVCFAGWFSRPENGLPMQGWTRHFSASVETPTVYFGGNALPEMWGHCELTRTLEEFFTRLRDS
jgi:hypothetical protein